MLTELKYQNAKVKVKRKKQNSVTVLNISYLISFEN